jgi:hypothetical protein
MIENQDRYCEERLICRADNSCNPRAQNLAFAMGTASFESELCGR